MGQAHLFNGLEILAVGALLQEDAGRRHSNLKALATHLFEQDTQLQLPTTTDL